MASTKFSSSLLCLLLLALLTFEACTAQTFHYSHGWTNGKRSGGTRPVMRDDVMEAARKMQADDERQGVRSHATSYRESK